MCVRMYVCMYVYIFIYIYIYIHNTYTQLEAAAVFASLLKPPGSEEAAREQWYLIKVTWMY